MKTVSYFTFMVCSVLSVFVIINDVYPEGSTKSFINGKVYTMDTKQPWADAVVIEGNKIVYVGDNEGAKKLINEKTEVYDLKGKMLLPGFIESHIHPAMGSLFSEVVILNQDSDKEQLLRDIRKAVARQQNEPVIGIMGFKASVFGPDGPTAKDLDKIENKKPVIILDYGGHSAWVNSKALEIGGITKETPDPVPGGHYYKRDKDGNPTGWCIEPMSFMPIIYKIGVAEEDIISAEEQLFPVISANGFTTVFDAGSFMEETMLKAYRKMDAKGKLPFRVYACHMITNPGLSDNAVEELQRLDKTYSANLLKVNTMKIVNDGTLEAYSCGMFDDFLTSKGNKGFELFPRETLFEIVKKSTAAGYNIHIHAIGNRTISDALNVFEKLEKKEGVNNIRKTICHVQFFMPDTVIRFKALKNVIAQTTPLWMGRDDNTLNTVGREIYERQLLFNSLDKAGVCVTFGSDFPVSSGLEGLNPFNEIEVGHTRRNIGAKESDILPPEAEQLPIDTLLRGYTINGVFQLGIEDILGSISVGKLADMIVIENNIFEQKPFDIHNNRVLMTIMDGKIAYDALNKVGPKKRQGGSIKN